MAAGGSTGSFGRLLRSLGCTARVTTCLTEAFCIQNLAQIACLWDDEPSFVAAVSAASRLDAAELRHLPSVWEAADAEADAVAQGVAATLQAGTSPRTSSPDHASDLKRSTLS